MGTSTGGGADADVDVTAGAGTAPASPPLSTKFPARPFNIAVTYVALIGVLSRLRTVSFPPYIPFSRSTMTNPPLAATAGSGWWLQYAVLFPK